LESCLLILNIFKKCKKCGQRLCFFKDSHLIKSNKVTNNNYEPIYYDPNFIIPSDDLIHMAFSRYYWLASKQILLNPYRWNALLEEEKQLFYKETMESLKMNEYDQYPQL